MSLARDRLRQWRAEMGHSYAAAAAAVGCDGSLIGHLELGRRYPGRRIAHAIEQATAAWVHGPIESREWDADEDADRKAAAAEVA